MTLPVCWACTGSLLPGDAEEGEQRPLCGECRKRRKSPPAPAKETTMASGICKEPGCGKPISTGKPSLGLCYGHLKHHPEAPPSIRAMARGGGRGKPRGGRPKAAKPARPKSDGKSAMRCENCGQAITGRFAKAVELLQANGVEDRAIAIRAAHLVLDAAG